MEQYDIIIIGTGAGGGTLLHKLKDSGKKILVLERGAFLPREKENWDSIEVFQKERYHTKEVWKTNGNSDLHPGTSYWVGGNTKVYGGALFRLRERDFERVQHSEGVSLEWPVKYDAYEPYYTEAEKLYDVHGKMGLDPTEPRRSAEYNYPAVSHEPRIQQLHDDLVKEGHHPFYIPLSIRLNEADKVHSPCIRCNTCDGFPCLVDAKGDADLNCVRPSLPNNNVTLLTEAKVTRLVTNSTGSEIDYVEVMHKNELLKCKADVVVVACGAINSAALLLKSFNSKHPKGLANKSDQVGRNFMKHLNVAMLGISTKPNPSVFQKTLAVNDFYWGDKDFKFPMGHVQLLGKSNKDQLASEAPFFTPGIVLDDMATHSIDWWLTGEDLAEPGNRVTMDGETLHLEYKENNMTGFNRLVEKWKHVLGKIDSGGSIIPRGVYLRKDIPISGVAHQVGTLRFGTDPITSVLDINCKSHEIDNLYVVDGSFFPSSGAVNPSLTIMANALRVGDHLTQRLK